MLLNSAKKAISDLYYIFLSYFKFFKKRPFDFTTDFKDALHNAMMIITNYEEIKNNIEILEKYNPVIEQFFYKTRETVGIRMEDLLVKDYFKSDDSARELSTANLPRIIEKALNLKNTIQYYFDFLNYYYSEHSGLQFRYNFIIQNLDQKLNEGKIAITTVAGFKNIRSNFLKLKTEFESLGLFNFGPGEYWYIDIIHFIYKCSKILEFVYLRSSRYEALKELRNDILFKVEKEIISFNKTK